MSNDALADRTVADVQTDLHRAIEASREALWAGIEPERLGERLYATWYAAPVTAAAPQPGLTPSLAQSMRATHAGEEAWETGWIAERVGPAAEVVARRGEEQRQLHRCDYTAVDRPGLAAQPGDELLATARRDVLDRSGWWCTHSPGWRLEAPEGKLTRLYWNVDPEAAPTLVGSLTRLLLDSGAPWMLKCAADRAQYVRADAAVLYLRHETVAEMAERIATVQADLADALQDGAPPLTLQALPGLAVADDPQTGESFGQHRCRLIAEAIVTMLSSAGMTGDRDSIMAAIAARFDAEGVPIERPYLADRARSLPWP